MRFGTIAVIVLIAALVAYAYTHDQPGCEKIAGDFVALGKDLASGKTITAPLLNPVQPASQEPSTGSGSNATPAAPAPASSYAPPPNAVTPSASPVPTDDAALAAWRPPAVVPSRLNWNLSTTTGTTYQNIRITQVDADCITILSDSGTSIIPMASLPLSLRQQLNYDPAAAAEAAARRQQQFEQTNAASVSLKSHVSEGP
jgi:hypothetical protein